MTRYKLKELSNTKKHEENIYQRVIQNVSKKPVKRNWLIPVLASVVSLAVVLFVFFQFTDERPADVSAKKLPDLFNMFYEIKGDGVAYSETFYPYDQQNFRTLKYYSPQPVSEFVAMNAVDIPVLPDAFDEATGEVIAVNDGMNTEFQFHFKEKGEGFLTISMTPFYWNPLDGDEVRNMQTDAAGNPITDVRIPAANMPLYFQQVTTDSAVVYSYYAYDEHKNRIHLTSTTANEFYAYYNGLIYHIGYVADVKAQEMISFVQDFIINNKVQNLQFEEMTTPDNWWVNGGKSIVIAITLVVVVSFLLWRKTKRESKKAKTILWGVATIFVIAPLVSWLIGMFTGILYGDGFAGMGMTMLTFPVLFLIGVGLVIRGVFMKIEV